jgi:acetyl-CoA/propionyl-CoA carboxylase biotin carboxyl carrier protein
MGIACIALVPPDQAGAWWVRGAHASVPLTGTYLDVDAVIAAARRCGADTIHPGYGFLAERPEAADAVVAAGLTWVGPPASAMRAAGDKAAARRLAASLGIPTLPGYDDDDRREAALYEAAAAVGYPLITKPAAGGGGKGMHIVDGPEELLPTVAQARREATAAFGDDRLVLERYLRGARHVEVQVLLDRFGGAVHLGERDCSLQRRHQKLLEEAPSPAVDHGLRTRLGDAALRLARAAGYVGAGTVEFLVDAKGQPWFLELNARLQVEHPVTELVTGRDLVADQLRIAGGEALGFTQDDVRITGHAIEARMYAEDPWQGFLPATGRVLATRWPDEDGLRVDAGVGVGDEVGTRYDPLLAKVIAHADTRAEAMARLDQALGATQVLGVTTGRGALRELLALPAVQAGAATTELVEQELSGRDRGIPDAAWEAAAAILAAQARGGHAAADRPRPSPPLGFRVNAPPRLLVALDGHVRAVDVPASTPLAAPWAIEGDDVVLDIDGRALRAHLTPPPTLDRHAQHVARSARVDAVVAPMPGNVVAIHVAAGDAVDPGQALVVIEAMKMEHAVAAPAAGFVARLGVAVGDQVVRGQTLIELD